MSQKETGSVVWGIVGFVLGALLIVAVNNKNSKSTSDYEPQVSVAHQKDEDREAEKKLLAQLSNDNAELKQSVVTLTSMMKELSKQQQELAVVQPSVKVVTEPTTVQAPQVVAQPQNPEYMTQLRVINSRTDRMEAETDQKLQRIQQQLNDLSYSAKGYLANSWVMDQKLNELTAWVKDSNNMRVVQRVVEVHKPMVVEPVKKEEVVVVPTKPQSPATVIVIPSESTTPLKTPEAPVAKKLEPVKPLPPKKVATVQKTLDVNPDLGPDDVESKPKFRNDQLK